jgi:hypothetical protein
MSEVATKTLLLAACAKPSEPPEPADAKVEFRDMNSDGRQEAPYCC